MAVWSDVSWVESVVPLLAGKVATCTLKTKDVVNMMHNDIWGQLAKG